MSTELQQEISKDAPIRSALKASTEIAHAAAEEHLLGGRKSFDTRPQYDRFLCVALQAHAAFGVAAATATGQDWLEREEDQRPSAARKLTAAEGWGAGYVLHGSAMGASLMLKTGYLNSAWPCSYLNHMRRFAQSGCLRRFFNLLVTECRDLDGALHGARLAFEGFLEPAT